MINKNKLIFIFLIFSAFFVNTAFLNLEYIYSWSGFSILQTIDIKLNFNNYLLNYPSGVETAYYSLLPRIYVFFVKNFGLNPLILNYFFIFLEIIFFSSSFFLFCKYLLGNNYNPSVFFLSLIIVIFTNFSINNISYFALKFHGQFYGFVYGIFFLTFYFVKKKIITFFLLILSFLMHPVFSIITFCNVVYLYCAKKKITKNNIFYFSVLMICFLFISKYQFNIFEDIEKVDLKNYINYLYLFNIHFIPFQKGMLTNNYQTVFFPFLAILGISIISYFSSKNFKEKKILNLIYFNLFIAFIGLLISIQEQSIFLIKLQLTRATFLLMFFFIILISNSFLNAFKYKNNIEIILYLLFFLILLSGQTYLLTLVYFLFVMYFFCIKKITSHILIVISMIKLLIIIFFFTKFSLFYLLFFLTSIVIFIFLRNKITIIKIVIYKFLSYFNYARFVIIFFVIIFIENLYFLKDLKSNEKISYHDTQIWAKENTSPDSVFIIDPCISGWRDISARPSVGIPKEWFMDGWLYSGSKKYFILGTKIASTLNINTDFYLDLAYKNIFNVSDLCNEISTKYLDQSGFYVDKLIKNHGAKYMVIRNSLIVNEIKYKIIFKNDYFTIYNLQ